MNTIDKDQIALIRKACNAATAGPWRVSATSSVVGTALSAQPDPTKNTISLAFGISAENATFAMVARTWLPRLLDKVEELEERRQYGADIINDMTLEAAQADAHLKQVEQQLVNVMRAFSDLRRMATGSQPQCVNLAAIDRVLATLTPADDAALEQLAQEHPIDLPWMQPACATTQVKSE